ncbi:MAG: UvrD-helicase domain-containing protein [Planctomycetes bacterium]|nr:UvrD-helicase domain-containing protein [Planctomycetota bacterium]
MSDPIYDDLNEQQQSAVAHGSGPMMVLAGAGSGKTRVVTRRIARLLRDGTPSGAILAMTFTNKAAGEMAHRVQQLGGDYVRVATFHSACARFLRRDGHHLGYPSDYSIYDVQDRDTLIKELMAEHGVRSSQIKPAAIGNVISRLKNAALAPDTTALGDDDIAQAVRKLWTPYHERMKQVGAMDFDDLLLVFLQLLREFPAVAERYRERFRYLLVDEFQDTNRVQYDLMKRLCPPPGNLCVVGDPDQSIYSFRGAEVRNILEFERDYDPCTIVRLEQNYRSTATILRAAENVIANNRQRLDKRLRTDNPDGDQLRRFRAATATEESAAIVDRIAELRDDGVELDQIAVFYRAHWLSRAIEQSLKTAGVPYTIVGGQTFFERREIKDLLAYLRVLVNPLDDVSMARIVNVPPRGIGKTSLEKLRQVAFSEGMSLREVVADPALHGALTGKGRKGLAELADALERARVAAGYGVHAALEVILKTTGYVQHATTFGDAEDSTREDNIKELISDAIEFDDAEPEDDPFAAPGEEPQAGVAGYLQHVALLTSADSGEGDGPVVQLMTVHAAKGLEFDHVMIAGLEEGVFPSFRSIDDADALEEERRLCYVALTRARVTAMLSHARERMVAGSLDSMRPSRFFKELPKDCIADYAPTWRRYELDDDVDHDTGWTVTMDPEQLANVRVGVRVRHQEYGSGQVTRLAGRGISARAVVRFDDGREREFVLEYAGLDLLEDSGF